MKRIEDITTASKEEVWDAWYEYHCFVQHNVIPMQGEFIKAYIEANKEKFKTVMVKKYYSSNNVLVPMLQIPQTYNTYYYRNGQVYKQLAARNRGVNAPY